MSQVKTKEQIYIGSVHDNPEKWIPFEFFHPKAGMRTVGELITFRTEGVGTPVLLVGLWRGGVGMPAYDPETNATRCYYDAPLGDETCQVVEGSVTITNFDTGDVHEFKAGDVFSISKGTETEWVFHGPYFRKLFIITQTGPLPDWFQG